MIDDFIKQLEEGGYGTTPEETAEVIKSLQRQLTECQKQHELVTSWLNPTREQLLACQAREKVLRDHLRWHIRVYRVADDAWSPEADCDRLMEREVGLPSESTALNTMLAAAELKGRREALLEAAERFNCMGTFRVRDELRRMALK